MVCERDAYGDDFAAFAKRLSVRATDDPIMTMNVYRIQFVSELVFATAALAFAGALLLLTARVWGALDMVAQVSLVFGFVTSAGLILYILVGPRLKRSTNLEPGRQQQPH